MPQIQKSAARFGLSAEQYAAAMEATLPIAARVGARLNDRHLVAIANAGGFPPSSELLASSENLYHEALLYAHLCIWPEPTFTEKPIGKVTPAAAVREVVTKTYLRFQEHPHAVRLIASENLFGNPDFASTAGLAEESPVVLDLDRVLMLGHDIGAFREGVSAEDVYVLISSLSSFAITQGPLFHSLYGMNPTDERNTKGLIELTVDAVLAFLTTTMPSNQGTSYTHSSQSSKMGSSVATSLYSGGSDFDCDGHTGSSSSTSEDLYGDEY